MKKGEILFCARELIVEESNKVTCLYYYDILDVVAETPYSVITTIKNKKVYMESTLSQLTLLLNVYIMNRLYVLFICVIFYSCSFNSPNSERIEIEKDTFRRYINKELLEIDINKKYPEKWMKLQDIATVEYIPLETNGVFLWDGIVDAFNDSIIIVHNLKDGNIFIFNHKGKAIKVINRKGSSGKEYSGISILQPDLQNHELFIFDGWRRNVLVYDLHGNFKRSFRYAIPKGRYDTVRLYDKDLLLVYYHKYDEKEKNVFLLISKENGMIVKVISIPPCGKKMEISFTERLKNGALVIMTDRIYPIQRYKDGFLLTELSSDTIYRFIPNRGLQPVFVRSPQIQSMELPVFLHVCLETDNYFFLKKVKKEWDEKEKIGYPDINLLYDKRNGEMYQYKIYNSDDLSKKPLDIKSIFEINDNILVVKMEASELINAFREGKILGKLKDITSNLKEDDNGVLMIIRFKK